MEIESVVINLSTKTDPGPKAPGPDGFAGEFYQICKEVVTPIFLKLFQKTEKK